MFCRNCGTELPDGAAFCANCGASQAESGTVATATAGDAGVGGPEGNVDELLMMVKQYLGQDYSIEKELGRGGMAVVYKGVEKALERVVAIKVVPPESANAGQAAERFRREARLAASLDHPNIIPVYRVGQAGPLHFMAMKFVEGRAVDAIIEQQGALPIHIAVAILRYSALGLAFAHEKKIVHRDIKGANILVDSTGRVMVSDFGIARALEEVSLTASGMMIGTPYFMSPEQCGGQKVSPQSDQYSLGILGFQMLTGEVPFLADSMVGVIQHHYMTPVPDITQVRSDVPKALLDVIYCSLNKDPADRFATTKDMATALENVPLTDAQREDAEKALKLLSMGKEIPKIRTGSLPPLSLTISGPGPKVQPRPATTPRTRPAQPAVKPKKKKKNRKALYQGLAVLGLTGAVAAYAGWNQFQATQTQAAQRRQDSLAAVQQAQAAAEAASKGAIVFASGPSMPANASIEIAGRVYTPNQVVPLDTGVFLATIRAATYSDLTQRVDVRAGVTDTLHPVMQLASATATVAQAPTGRSTPTAPIVRDSGEVGLNIQPLQGEARLADGTLLGVGRVLRKLPVGTHTIRVSLAGCQMQEFEIEIRANARTPRAVNLVCR